MLVHPRLICSISFVYFFRCIKSFLPNLTFNVPSLHPTQYCNVFLSLSTDVIITGRYLNGAFLTPAVLTVQMSPTSKGSFLSFDNFTLLLFTFSACFTCASLILSRIIFLSGESSVALNFLGGRACLLLCSLCSGVPLLVAFLFFVVGILESLLSPVAVVVQLLELSVAFCPKMHCSFSADATSMYTNIETQLDVASIQALLSNNITLLPPNYPTNLILQMFTIVMENHIFSFADTFWKQQSGTVMGTPVPCTYAMLSFGQYKNAEILPNYQSNLIYYRRYIDDILGI
jgi:hypothetical protein